MQKANINLSMPLYVNAITKLFLSKCSLEVPAFLVHSIYLYDVQNVIRSSEDGTRVWGLLGSAHLPCGWARMGHCGMMNA